MLRLCKEIVNYLPKLRVVYACKYRKLQTVFLKIGSNTNQGALLRNIYTSKGNMNTCSLHPIHLLPTK